MLDLLVVRENSGELLVWSQRVSDFHCKLEYPRQELEKPKVLQNNFSVLQNKQRRIQMKAMLEQIPIGTHSIFWRNHGGLFCSDLYHQAKHFLLFTSCQGPAESTGIIWFSNLQYICFLVTLSFPQLCALMISVDMIWLTSSAGEMKSSTMPCLLALFCPATDWFFNSWDMVPREQIVTPMPYTTDHVLYEDKLCNFDINYDIWYSYSGVTGSTAIECSTNLTVLK